MLGMLFTMLFGFGGMFYRMYRKQARLTQSNSAGREAAESALPCKSGQPE
jgi:hypothetical protein